MVLLEFLTMIMNLLSSPVIFCTLCLLDENFEYFIPLNKFPDDILMDVLSRLPAYDLVRNRTVCKRWRSLTSSHQFIELQRQNAPTVVFGECIFRKPHSYKEIRFGIVEEKCNKSKGMGIRLKPDANVNKCTPLLIDSFGEGGELLLFLGLFVRDFQDKSKYLVFNPISRESRFLQVPCDSNGKICGLFFHPSVREYKVLCWKVEENGFKYYIYDGLGNNIGRMITATPLFYRPAIDEAPVVVQTHLHWIVNYDRTRNDVENDFDPCMHTIMKFNIISEEFCTLPHPGFAGCEGGYQRSNISHRFMNLFEMDKKLRLSHIFPDKNRICIWMLNDYEKWGWSTRHSVTIEGIPQAPRNIIDYCNRDDLWHRNKVICIEKDILVVNYFGKGLYRLHLTLKTFQRVCDDVFRYGSGEGIYLCTAYRSCFTMPVGEELV